MATGEHAPSTTVRSVGIDWRRPRAAHAGEHSVAACKYVRTGLRTARYVRFDDRIVYFSAYDSVCL